MDMVTVNVGCCVYMKVRMARAATWVIPFNPKTEVAHRKHGRDARAPFVLQVWITRVTWSNC